MQINEIFPSIQGEGPDAGLPAIFVRLQGCNLSCKYCDTQYSWGGNGYSMTVDAVADAVRNLSSISETKFVVITGGEPLLQSNELLKVINALRIQEYHFAVETNGTQPLPPWWKMVVWDVDRKCPSSGYHSTAMPRQWSTIGKRNRIKFVVGDEHDLEFVLSECEVLSNHNPLRPEVIVSPVLRVGMYGKSMRDPETRILDFTDNCEWARRVWQFCAQHNLRFSLQVHKVLWDNQQGI